MKKNKIIVTGGSSGLGQQIITSLNLCDTNELLNIDILQNNNNDINTAICDVRHIDKLKLISSNLDNIDILINCAGINYIDWIENTSDETWNRIMDVNAKGTLNTVKAFMEKLIKSNGTILNIISNASHMPTTNSIAYNASKGALHIMTLQMSRELGPKGITVFGISPNKLSGTTMSNYINSEICKSRGWTEEYAEEYQLKNLPVGEKIDPTVLAEFIAFILSNKKRHKYFQGTIIPYGK